MARTHGDTWTLASSVGSTATGVAASRALATKQPEPLINDPFADALVKAVGLDYCNRIADGDLHVEGDPMLDRRRMCEQIAVRTRYFDDFVTDAAAAGLRQAVILAAGLDTRAYRLALPAESVLFEVDQPEVVAFKTATLADIGAEPAVDRRPVGIDLRDDWPTMLRDNGFDVSQPTVWIAEGLLIYLPPDAQDRLFDFITSLSASGSRLATEHMDFGDSAQDWINRVSEWSRRAGSDVDLAELFYTGDRNSARDYLQSLGWDVHVRPTPEAYSLNGFKLPEETAELSGRSGYLSATLMP